MADTHEMPEPELHAMIAEYMEKGFLENIQDMFRHDPSLWRSLALLIADERSRVRIGAVILVEDLKIDPVQMEGFIEAIPSIAEVLAGHAGPTMRGDAAFLLATIGHPDALPHLKAALGAEGSPAVREAIADAMADIAAGVGD